MANVDTLGRMQWAAAVEQVTVGTIPAATVFHKFPDLPVEIRHMIWDMIWLSASGPHLIDMQVMEDRIPMELKVVTTRPRTVLLDINQESRGRTRGLSKLKLTTTRKPWIHIVMPKHQIFVDLQRDTFRMNPEAIHCLNLHDLSQIRTLEITMPRHVEPGYLHLELFEMPSVWKGLFASNKVSFLACTSLERFVLRMPARILGDAIISSEEPDWAEQIAALFLDSHYYMSLFRTINLPDLLKRNWNDQFITHQRLVGNHSGYPTWIPPTTVVSFYGPNSYTVHSGSFRL